MARTIVQKIYSLTDETSDSHTGLSHQNYPENEQSNG